MRYLDSFKKFEGNVHDIGLEDDIENNCFVEMIDRGFKIRIIPFYIKSNGRHFVSEDNGIDITISNNTLFQIEDIMDELLTAKEYIEEKYDMKLDFINKNMQYDHTYYKNFDELIDSHLEYIRITFRPINIIDKTKSYIMSKFKNKK
jgi:hypothetical protein